MTRQEQQEKLFRAIGYVGDDLIQRADAPAETRRSSAPWIKWAALAACCVLVISLAARLPLLQMKTASPAPEAAAMQASESTAAAEEKAEAPDMTEEAAAEAPAEAEDNTAGAREPAATDTEGQKDGVSVQQALLLDTTLGPVKLGMPSADVRSILARQGGPRRVLCLHGQGRLPLCDLGVQSEQ